MREFLPPLRPRRVLWFYYGENDLADLTDEKAHPILARYLEPAFTQRLAERQSEVDRRLRALAVERESWTVADQERAAARRAAAPAAETAHRRVVRVAWSILTLAHLRDQIAEIRRPPPPERPCCDMALLRRVVLAMQATVAGWGGDLTMVYLPSEQLMAGRPTRPGERAGDSVVAIVKSLGVPVLDLRSVLGRFGSSHDLYAYEEAHFSPRGHQAVSTLVLDLLMRRDSLGPPSADARRPETRERQMTK